MTKILRHYTTTGASNTNSYQYTGRENDGTGLYYYRARYYQPSLQRFIGEDPLNLASTQLSRQAIPELAYMHILLLRQPEMLPQYTYVANSPLGYRDPSGLIFLPGAAIGFGIGAIGGAAGALAQGGGFGDVAKAAAIGGATGAVVGGIPVASPYAGAAISAIGDVFGQFMTSGGRKDFDFNFSSVIGSAVGGAAGIGFGNSLAKAVSGNGFGKGLQAALGALGGMTPTALGSAYGHVVGEATGF